MTRELKRPSPALVVACTALLVALGTAAYAANTVGSSDIIDGAILAEDISDAAVTQPKLASDAVTSVNVLDNSLTSADVKGANVNRNISLAAGSIVNGRCRDFSVVAGGATVGEVVVVSLRSVAPEGMLFYGVRVRLPNQAVFKVCNFTGGPSPLISNLPYRVVTFG